MGFLAEQGIKPEDFQKELVTLFASWAQLPGDQNTRLEKEDGIFFASAMMVDLVKEETALHTPEVLDAFYNLATASKAPFMRDRGLELLHDLASGVPAYAAGRAFDAAQKQLSDADSDLASHAASTLANMAMEKLPGAENAGVLLAEAMGSGPDAHARRMAGITFTQHYPYLVKSADDWDKNLSPVFKKAAAANGVDAAEVAEAEASVKEMRDFLAGNRKPGGAAPGA
ncbi:MAG: hypothetical protein ACAH83_07330 [Alphaproteobacteria bacterium]